MRNASEADVKKAQETGKLETNVMYRWGSPKLGKTLVHGSKLGDLVVQVLAEYEEFKDKSVTLCETSDGVVHTCDLAFIHPISKGPAQQPKKPRRKPIKGTKPEQLIPMNESVKLKVGDKVVLKGGIRTTIIEVDGTDTPYRIEHRAMWNRKDGTNIDANWDSVYSCYNITHKIIPWQEQERYSSNIDPAHSVLKYVEPKSPEQEAFEKGYWVPHNATHSSVCPPWAENVLINTVLGDEEYIDQEYAVIGSLWKWDLQGSRTIVAYRKAPNQ